jgi:hypothetical protein
VQVRRRRLYGLEVGEVVTFRNLHEYGMVRAFQFVVLLQFLPESVHLNPDDGVRLGIEVLLAAESLDADRVLLDFVGVCPESPGG